MAMNLEQLRGFVEVARTGSFTRAAADLHLAQPSLSRQISTLERELGSDLFHRARGNIALTPAGETLLPYARRMLADAEAVRQEMDEIAGLRQGRVRLGTPPSLCASIVAEALAAFRIAHPGVAIEIVERGSRGLIAALGEGALDLALVTSSDADAVVPVSLTRMALLNEELVVVSAASHPPLVSRGPLMLADVARIPQVAFPRSYDLRATTDAAFAAAGLTPAIAVDGPEMDAVLRFVERGVGIAIIPATMSIGRDGLRATPLASPRLSRTVSLAHRADVRPTRAAAVMRDTIVATADALVGAGAFVTRAD